MFFNLRSESFYCTKYSKKSLKCHGVLKVSHTYYLQRLGCMRWGWLHLQAGEQVLEAAMHPQCCRATEQSLLLWAVPRGTAVRLLFLCCLSDQFYWATETWCKSMPSLSRWETPLHTSLECFCKCEIKAVISVLPRLGVFAPA